MNKSNLPPVQVIFQEAKPDPSPGFLLIVGRAALVILIIVLLKACEAMIRQKRRGHLDRGAFVYILFTLQCLFSIPILASLSKTPGNSSPLATKYTDP